MLVVTTVIHKCTRVQMKLVYRPMLLTKLELTIKNYNRPSCEYVFLQATQQTVQSLSIPINWLTLPYKHRPTAVRLVQ